MKKSLALICFLLIVVNALLAQDFTLYEKHQFVRGDDTLPYRLLLPKDYDASKKYPLIVVLHGSGERGSDNEKQLVHGGELFVRDSIRTQYPAIVVFPQCPEAKSWNNMVSTTDSITKKRIFHFNTGGDATVPMQLLMDLVKNIQHDFKTDKKRIYVGGLSMGGMGTFELVRRMPKTFAAAFPICGGANPATASKLTQTHWWIFHGLKDDVVPPELSIQMEAALKTAGANVKLTLYPNANHNSWDSTFAEPDLMRWIFSNHK